MSTDQIAVFSVLRAYALGLRAQIPNPGVGGQNFLARGVLVTADKDRIKLTCFRSGFYEYRMHKPILPCFFYVSSR